MECGNCGKQIPEGSSVCPECGAADKKEKGTFKTALAFVAIVIGAGILLVAAVVAAITLPGLLGSRDREKFETCLSALGNVQNGIEKHISRTGSTMQLDAKADEICDIILPGHSSKDSCKGLVKQKTDKACASDSFNIVFPGETKYEISAKVKDSSSCAICVSEAGASPRQYSLCNTAEPVCEH